MANRYFTHDTLDFLAALAANNRREWLDEHKPDYEATVRVPALNFISDIGENLAQLSPHFLALPKKVGGALMRVNRDIRFGKDKHPYKTNIGIQFWHEVGKIRDDIVDKGDAWLKAGDDKMFTQKFSLAGDTLTNAPGGYAKDHPLLEDLKRKDFIAIARLSGAAILAKNFYPKVLEHFAAATPYMRYLCKALDLRF